MNKSRDIFELLKAKTITGDAELDMLYPEAVRHLSERHFTPYKTASMAINLLVKRPGEKILDIGSGVGKFCFVASQETNASIYGIELRRHFYELACSIAESNRIKNVNFIHGDFCDLDFTSFDGFYFYNAFEEYINQTCIIDQTVEKSESTHSLFLTRLREKLSTAKQGARLVTYYTKAMHVPECFNPAFSAEEGNLRLWIKS